MGQSLRQLYPAAVLTGENAWPRRWRSTTLSTQPPFLETATEMFIAFENIIHQDGTNVKRLSGSRASRHVTLSPLGNTWGKKRSWKKKPQL